MVASQILPRAVEAQAHHCNVACLHEWQPWNKAAIVMLEITEASMSFLRIAVNAKLQAICIQ